MKNDTSIALMTVCVCVCVCVCVGLHWAGGRKQFTGLQALAGRYYDVLNMFAYDAAINPFTFGLRPTF
jgi:hypothetical protein